MQISSVQSVSGADRTTPDRTESRSPVAIQQQTSQDHVRQVARAVKLVNQSGQITQNNELTIALDRTSGHPVIRLIDRATHEVIRQIPEERVLRMAEEFKRETAQQEAALGGTES